VKNSQTVRKNVLPVRWKDVCARAIFKNPRNDNHDPKEDCSTAPKRTSAILGHDERTRGTAGAKERRLIRKYLTYLPLIGFLVSLVIALVLGVDDWKVTALEVGLFWLVGISGILLGSAHLFTPAPVAKAIGWPSSRFQWEVGLAGVGYGVAGAMAPAFDRGFWLATIIVFSIFMLGAAVGHIRSMIAEHNFAPGNAGYIFWYDILAPAFLVVMYVATR
jgi:hypothetical protein